MDAGLDLDEHVVAPQPSGDLGVGHQLAMPLDQEQQQIQRTPLETHSSAVAAQFVGRRIELVRAEAVGATGAGVVPHGRSHRLTIAQTL
jgi:hypothetical protein